MFYIKEFENCLEINIYTGKKFVECPSCHFLTNNTHDYRTQRIQHINIGKKITFLILKKRRYACHHCGKKFYELYSFLQKYFRKSNAVFENVCKDFKSLKNFKTIANDNNISSPTVVDICITISSFLTNITLIYLKKLVLMNLKVIVVMISINFISLILILEKLLILLNLENMTIWKLTFLLFH